MSAIVKSEKPDNPFANMSPIFVNLPAVPQAKPVARGKSFVVSAFAVMFMVGVAFLAACFAFRQPPKKIVEKVTEVVQAPAPAPIVIHEPAKVIVKEVIKEVSAKVPVKEPPKDERPEWMKKEEKIVAQMVKDGVIPPPPPRLPITDNDFVGTWKRKGNFAIFRLQRDGKALTGTYIPVSNHTPPQLQGGQVDGHLAHASARVGKVWDYEFELRKADEMVVTYRLNINAAVSDMAAIKGRNAYETAMRRKQWQAEINEFTGVVKLLGVFERVEE